MKQGVPGMSVSFPLAESAHDRLTLRKVELCRNYRRMLGGFTREGFIGMVLKHPVSFLGDVFVGPPSFLRV